VSQQAASPISVLINDSEMDFSRSSAQGLNNAKPENMLKVTEFGSDLSSHLLFESARMFSGDALTAAWIQNF
jgi:hypothetical protein